MNKKTEVNRIIKIIILWFLAVIKFISALISIALFLFIMSCLIDSNKTDSWVCIGSGIYFNTQSIKIKNDIMTFEGKTYDSKTGGYTITTTKIEDPSTSFHCKKVNLIFMKSVTYDKNDKCLTKCVNKKEYNNLKDICNMIGLDIEEPIELTNSFVYNYLKLKYDNYKRLKPLKIAIIVEIILFIIALISIILYYKKKIKLINGDTIEQENEIDNSNNNLTKEEDVNEEN